mmetsp:Transcript_16336/g.41193  ORF Transcript_16336/g.41193 Transcript_16336/m.41193 type:complete len:299 (-) Transcript_16336:40-936(-)
MGADFVAESHDRLDERRDVRLVAAAAGGEREAEVVLRRHAEDAQQLGDVHGGALEEESIGAAPFLLHLHLVRERLVGDAQQRRHRARRVEVIRQAAMRLRLQHKQSLRERALQRGPRGRLRQPRVAQHRLHHPEEALEPLLLRLGVVDGLVAVVHRLVPRLQQEHQPDLPRRVALERLADGDEVLEALAHLEPLDLEVARVQKVVDPRAAVEVRLRLRELVLVVRELEVGAARVEVDGVAEQVGRHRGALDVPPRPAGAPRRGPRGLAALRRLPQHEVGRLPLVGAAVGGERALAFVE